MRKGANVVEPTFRVTRARAAACKNSEAPKDQGQDRPLRKNPKRSVQVDTNNTTNKRRAVLKDVTNICCDNSYKNCIIPAKIPKKTSKISKKNPIKPDHVSAQTQTIAVDHIVDLDKTVIHQKSIQPVEKESADQIGKRVGSQFQKFSKKGRNNIPEKTMEASNKVDFKDIDTDEKDPQMCSFYALEIYNNLRASELVRRPHSDFMEKVQRDVTQSMRGVLVDWLVEVSEEYKLVADTLYLTVYLIDLFLSQHYIERQKLQLLGITCMLIASKYEEMCAPSVEEFCFITDSTYTKSEVVKMEGLVLNELNFQCASPTAKTFLRRFLRAAQASEQVPSLELEFLANYLTELTLIDYNFLVFVPSKIAASAVFLARWTLDQSHHPWNDTLQHYTSYKPSDLKNTVLALHGIKLSDNSSPLNAIRSKYRQDKFKSVANLASPQLPETLF
ncbi:hypothetical protein LXL04_008519 [Taraxacum kok-saghyz]